MRTPSQASLAFLVAILAWEGACTRPTVALSAPQAAPVRPVTETLPGLEVTDPYRWMEDGGQELTDWMKAQDACARALLGRIPGRQELLDELRALNTGAAAVTRLRRVGDRYVYLKRNAGDQVAKLCVREASTEVERVLVDPATLGDGEQRFTIGDCAPSPAGRHVAFTAAPDGTGIADLRVIEVATGRTLGERIGRVAYFNSWRPDGLAFRYTRERDLLADAPASERALCPTTCLHIVGTEAAADRALVGCGISP